MASQHIPGTFKDLERTGWHERAPSYDDRVGRRTRTIAARLVDAVGAAPGKHFLDVCCGPGYSAGEAAARGADALGIDIAPAMVEEARRLFPQASFRIGDAEALDLLDASRDAVVCAFGMLHLPQPERAIAEVFRVLRPGGRYAWTVWTSGDTAPLSAIAQQAIKDFGNLDVPLPPAPPRDLFSSERNAHAALEKAGFHNVLSEELAITFRAASLEEVWDWYERGTVRTAALLHLQTPEALERIKAAILAGAARFVGADGLSAPHNAIMHVASKPDR
jgi:ubiquinone/menaquinone biosynthesis C-methylase UbiE